MEGLLMGDKVKLDKNNYRKHSDVNKKVIKKSLQELGAGRSIVIDNENYVVAGNGVFEQAEKLNIPIKIVESDGSQLFVIKRTDLKKDSDKRKKLALADNQASDLSEFDFDLIFDDFDTPFLEELEFDIEPTGKEELKKVEDDRPFIKSHILLSFSPEKLIEIQDKIEEISQVEGV
jgi:hypothetical protein